MRFAGLAFVLLAAIATPAMAESRLEGLAVIPAGASAPAPRAAPAWLKETGAFALTGAAAGEGERNGFKLPMKGQALQGVSSLRAAGDGTYWALSDNGFGAQLNSADALLMMHRIAIDWAAGGVRRLETITLSDPNRVAPFRIVTHGTRERFLTGADFDPESLASAPGGGFWIGDEFGPALLKIDARGRLERVVTIDGLASPDRWGYALPAMPGEPGPAVTVGRSRGFEGVAMTPDGKTLVAALEAPLAGEAGLRILALDPETGAPLAPQWRLGLSDPAHKLGEITMIGADTALVVERDDADGAKARVKRVLRVRLPAGGGAARVEASLDLLDVADPSRLSGGARYAMPFVTIESVEPVGDGRLLVASDNNFPFSAVRAPGRADGTEIALLAAPDFLEGKPLVIGHRGASGERPEHTLMAYELAIAQGADFIEPDLVMTKDGVLVARHENEISETTDVAARPEFAARKRTQTIDGERVTGWFTEDFTLAELKTLRAKERLPQLRPANTAFDGQESVPTFEEVLALAARQSARLGRRIGVYPETKHPSHFRSIGLPMEAPLVEALARHGFDGPEDPVFIQSFETANLKALAAMTRVRRIQLIAAEGAPWDFTAAGASRRYADLLTDAGLAEIATYAQGIGVEKRLVLPRDGAGASAPPTDLVARAHRAGLLVHLWTLRSENHFLPADLKVGASPAARGDGAAEAAAAFAAGVDGVFADFPADALRGRAAAAERR